MLGRELRLPVDLVFPPVERSVPDNYPDYVAEIERRVFVASEYARHHLRLSWDAMNTSNQVSRRVPQIDLTRPILVFNPSLKKGVTPKLEGPI
jgi:hypothetical protein